MSDIMKRLFCLNGDFLRLSRKHGIWKLLDFNADYASKPLRFFVMGNLPFKKMK